MSLGSLFVKFGADVSDFVKGAQTVEKKVGDFKRSVEGEGKSATDKLNSALKLLGVTSGVSAATLLTVAVRTSAAADAIDEMSQRTGINRSRLQELQYACGQTGVRFDSLESAVARMTMSMGQADEEGQVMAEAFKRLGVETRDSNGALRETDAVFEETLRKLAGMSNQTERNVLAQKIFGRGAMELVPLLNQGEKGIAALTARAHELGLVMSDEAIASNAEFADALDELKRSFGALMGQLATGVLPLLKALFSLAGGLIGVFRGLLDVLGLSRVAEMEQRLAMEKKAALESVAVEERAVEAKIAAASLETRTRLANLDKEKEAVRKSLESQRQHLEETHNAAIDAIREEYGVAQVLTNSKTDLARRASQAVIESLEAEAQTARTLHDQRMRELDEEYAGKLKLLDDETAAAIATMERQISMIDEATKAEEDAAYRASMEKRIADEGDADRRRELVKELKRWETLQEREATKESLRAQIEQIRSDAADRRKTLEDELKSKQETEAEKLAAELDRIETAKTAENTALEQRIQGIQRERLEVEAAENAKYLAAKASLNNRLEGLNEHYVLVKAQLEADVKAYEEAERQKNAVLIESLAARRKAIEDYYVGLAEAEAAAESTLEREAAENLRTGGWHYGPIPEFHTGGEFHAPTPGGEGLALLRDREQVLAPGGVQPVTQINNFYGMPDRATEIRVADTINRRLRRLEVPS